MILYSQRARSAPNPTSLFPSLDDVRTDGPTSRIISLGRKEAMMKEPTLASLDSLNLTILRVHYDWLMQHLHLRARYTCLSAATYTVQHAWITISRAIPPLSKAYIPLGAQTVESDFLWESQTATSLHHVPLKFRPFITSAVRRLFPGEGSGEPEPESRGSEGIRKLKRLLKSKSKANYRRRKEIERLNDALRVARDGEHKAKDDRAVCQRENYRLMDTLRVARDREQKAKDDRAACQRENYRLMDELRSERQRDPLKELDPDLKVVFGIGLLTVGVIMICLMVIAFKVIKKIPFQTLFNWCMIFLRHALNTMYRHWVEHGYPLLLQLLEHCSDPELTEGKDGQT
ncbi:uncharacterized protein EV420DRAFT_1698881 [Desarmillaria tabescens]|uniref:Uncharacterized protein n=1 Tax=Armillaria tabescens TaxID=1929756 RepID=A0AA39TYM6_ARMTA|nr:uncharacterized protein EV420DRAFT_1698881 [Desarmillaria tabescens]KAK0466874.1 hypothetical protein EV420DRAFT_1698881 [Desarmillaria tabescens]